MSATKAYVVIKHSAGYYEGEYHVSFEGVFSTPEAAKAKAAEFTLDRHDVDVIEAVMDDPKASEYLV